MAKAYQIRHYPTVAYSPWVNGTIERLNRDILSALRAMLGELKLAPQDWRIVIGSIQTVINESSEARLGKNDDGSTRSAFEVMTGIRPRRRLIHIVQGPPKYGHYQIDHSMAEKLCSIDMLAKSIHNMHKEVHERISPRQQRVIDEHNRATNIVWPKFSIRGLVVVCEPELPSHKLGFSWPGPQRVIGTKSSAVLVVEDLITKKVDNMHTARVRKYFGSLDGRPVPDDVLNLADCTAAKYDIVERILDVRKHADKLWVKGNGKGCRMRGTIHGMTFRRCTKMCPTCS